MSNNKNKKKERQKESQDELEKVTMLKKKDD